MPAGRPTRLLATTALTLLLTTGLTPVALATDGPVADAGADQTVTEGTTVSLDAGASTVGVDATLTSSTARSTLPGGTSLGVGVDGVETAAGGLRLRGSADVGQAAATASTSLAYVIDVSASTDDVSGCGGDQNHDGRSDSVLDCEIAAAVELNRKSVASGTVASVSLVQFSSDAAAVDLDPSSGSSTLVAPDADADGDGEPDVVSAMRRLRSAGSTNFVAPARLACDLLAPAATTNRLAAFLSDGQGSGDLTSTVPCSPAVTFQTFAVGRDSSCAAGDPGTQLVDLATLTGGRCTSVLGVADLPAALPAVLASQLSGVSRTVDGGAPVDVGVAPVDGPGSAPVSAALPAHLADGTHRVCLVATGRDAGGTGSTRSCSDLAVAGGTPSYGWRVVSASGPAVTLSAADTAHPTFRAVDDGSYVLELTVTDASGRTATDRVGVRVVNADPTVTAAVGDAYVGGVTRLTGSFTDAGAADTHSAVVSWGDGTTDTVAPTSDGGGAGSFAATHSYQAGGGYPVGVRLVDDDGGVAEQSLGTLTVQSPVAVWAGSASLTSSFDWGGASGSIDGRLHTNGQLRFVGAAKVVRGTSTYAGVLAADTTRNSFTPAPVKTGTQGFPFAPRIADYRPGGLVSQSVGAAYHDVSSSCSNGAWSGPVSLPAGVYYATCDIRLSGSQVGGNVTLVSEGHVRISGSKPTFEAYHDGLLALAGATGAKAIDVPAQDSTFHGTLFAGNGQLSVSGSSNQFDCGLLADTVDVSGGGVAIRAGLCGRSS